MPIAIFAQKRQSGFTFIEMLVSMAVSGILMAALTSVLSLHATTMSVEDAHRAAQTTARGTLEFIVRQLSHIGRVNVIVDPLAVPFTAADPAILNATADSIRYRTNLSADSADYDTLDAGEDVGFSYSASYAAIWFNDYNVAGNTSALTSIGDRRKSYIPAGGLGFTYFDADGNAVVANTIPARASIRRITVTLTVRGIDPQLPQGHADEPKVVLSQNIFLRNVP